jgi:hypothetical protein
VQQPNRQIGSASNEGNEGPSNGPNAVDLNQLPNSQDVGPDQFSAKKVADL